MGLRSLTLFAGIFLASAIGYSGYFNAAIRLDADAAQHRFDYLMDRSSPIRAARHGERAIHLATEAGATEDDLAPLKIRVASAKTFKKDYSGAADFYADALSTSWAAELDAPKRIALESDFANASIKANNIKDAVYVYSTFLEAAGDAVAHKIKFDNQSLPANYAKRVSAAAENFAAAINHHDPFIIEAATEEETLGLADRMATLGAHYAMRRGSEYAAAGLLSSAYEARRRHLGGDHQRTVQIALVLGPLYIKIGQLKEAEQLYLDAFHAQENVKGPNSTDLSLYIKLLAGVYEKQERYTEAQALNEHMRRVFRDSFGEKRYAANQNRDRSTEINRPVSRDFPLNADDQPGDLVIASTYSVPIAKAPSSDEMKIRLAPDVGLDQRENNLPVRLAQLISLCQSDSGEQITLRSGYRAYETQRILYERLAYRGTVTPPGTSEHQTGLAVDINVNNRFMRQTDQSYQCFEENAFRFGFILSYPPGNDYLPGENSYEPWHWRYVGLRTAQLYREAGPLNKPQEFLAALPCYEQRAATGVFPTAGEPDICVEGPVDVAQTTNEAIEEQPTGENPNAARILNNRP